MGTLEIGLLGGFLLKRDGVPLEPIASRTARSLLAFLAMNRERPHTRDLLSGTFWPDLPDSRARRRLSQALWQIRSRVEAGPDSGPRLLLAGGDTLRLNPQADLRLDVAEFEAALRQAAVAAPDPPREADLLAAAIRLYRGDLLDGFYDDWAVPDRERLRERFLGALERLCRLVMSRGDYETALVHAKRLTQADPLREEAHALVMRLAALLGRHNDALRQYEVCRRILTEELAAQPSAATRQVYEAILKEREAGRPAAKAPPGPLFEPAGPVPLVGREQERSHLARLLDAALEGRGSLVLVEGEPGVGKTRLLAEAADDARWRGMDVLWGGCSPNAGRPYAPFAEALARGLSALRARQMAQRLEPAWRAPLEHLLPALAAGEPATQGASPLRPSDEQERMRESIALGFLALAALAPLLLVLEDVHWADEDTMRALAHLGGRTEGHRLVIAVSYRHAEARERAEVWGLLRSLDQRPSCSRLSLSPCSPAQTEELIRRCLDLPDVAADFSQRVHQETGGVPLFVIEALRAQYEQGRLAEASAHPASRPGEPPLPLTPRVLEVIRIRLGGLSEEARAVLDLVSVHDGELTLAEIIAAAGLPDAAVLQGVDELAGRRLLTERPEGFRVAHDLLRRVAYEELPPASCAALHRSVALAVEAGRPDQVEVLAHHFTVAGTPDRAADYLEKAAARALSMRAYDTAAFHLSRAAEALDAFDAPADRHFRVAASCEEVLDVLARRADQEQALARMARHASGDQVGDVHRRRAWWLAHQDRFAEAEDEARLALDLAQRSKDGGRAVAALSTLGMIACYAGRAADGVVYLEQAATFRGADRRQQADARNALGQNLLDLQRFDEAEPQLLAALALYGELHDARGQAEAHGMLGTLRMERGESDLAEADFLRAIELSRTIGFRHGEAVHQMNLGILFALTSRPRSAIDAFAQAGLTYSSLGNNRGQALVWSNAAWTRHAVLGDDAGAERDARLALEIYQSIGDKRGKAQCLATVASVDCRRGNHDEGMRLFQESLALADEAGDAWIGAQVLKEWARCELEAGLLEEGLQHTAAALTMCREKGMPDLAVSLEALKGRLLLAQGRTEVALQSAQSAIRELTPGVDQAHLVAYSYALALAATGRQAEADQYLLMAHRQLISSLSDLPDDQQAAALENVPAHHEVVEAWSHRVPLRTTFRLARAGVPSGGRLGTDDLTNVTWTLTIPGEDAAGSPSLIRQGRLRRLLEEASAQGGVPTVRDLAQALGSSVATIRRDLAAFRSAGQSATTRGTKGRARV